MRPFSFFIMSFVYFLLLFIITIISSSNNNTIDLSAANIPLLKIIQCITVILVFILPSLIFAQLFHPDRLRFFHLNRAPSFKAVAFGVLFILCAVPLIGFLEELNKHFSLPQELSRIEDWMRKSEENVAQIEKAFMDAYTVPNLIGNLVVIALFAAISEELFFRGLLQGALMGIFKNTHIAVWSTALLFSAFHLQFFGFIPRVILGAILGYAYCWTGSLWTNIFMHFINNGIVLVLDFLIHTKVLPDWVDKIGMENTPGIFLWVSSSILASGLCGWFLYKSRLHVAE